MVSDSDPPPLVDLVGPFYSHQDLREWLRLDDQQVAARISDHTLLAIPLADGTPVYPDFQFTADGGTISHLPAVLCVLAAGSPGDPWTWATWLTAPDDDLDGLTSAQWLAAGRDPEPVLAEARADAARWVT